MKARRYITQFYRILPSRAVEKQYIHKKSSKKLHEFRENEPFTRIHDEHPLMSLVWTGPYGKALLYAVRMIDTYVLTINGRSKLYHKATDIYKALVGKKIIPDNPVIKEAFKDYQMLDLEEMVFLINSECGATGFESRADFNKLPAYDWIIEQEDVHYCHLGKTSSMSFIPCLHEDKVVIELFLETSTLTDERRAELKQEGYKEFISSYIPSDGAIQELLERIGVYF